MAVDNKPYDYKTCISEWGKRVFRNDGLKICIARKAPRLLEVLQENKEKWGLAYLESVSYDEIISEHALPFVLPDYISTGQNFKKLLVADDSVYYGSTLERIINVTAYGKAVLARENYEPEKIDIESSVISNKASVQLNKSEIYLISDKYLPYHIERLSSDFISLNKPYDIEYPILSFDVGNVEITQLKKSLIEIFGQDKVYANVHLKNQHREEAINFSVLISTNADVDISIPEFFKLRIYVKGNVLRIVSFAPHIISDNFLHKDSPIFAETLFDGIWRQVVNKAKKIDIEDRVGNISEAENRKLQEEYNYHVNRSLNIWMNYLLSFSKLIEIKEQINKILKSLCDERIPPASLDINDLRLLLGSSLSAEMKEKLENLYNNVINIGVENLPKNKEFHIGNKIPNKIIPSAYRSSFDVHNKNEWTKCKSVSELTSSLFNNIHHDIELASRKYLVAVDRLRFGVSIESMCDDFIYYISENTDDFTLDIHKAIDKRIDEGSIVPKYVGIQTDDSFVWRRLFRAGENEDRYREQLFRLSLFLLSSIQIHYNSRYISQDIVENVFVFVLGNIRENSMLENLGGISYDLFFDGNGDKYRLRFNHGNNTEEELENKKNFEFLLDYLVKYNILITNSKDNTCCVNDSISNISPFVGGTTLDTYVEDAIRKEIAFIINLHKEEIDRYDFREIINIFNVYKSSIFYKNLKERFDKYRWKNRLKEILSDNTEKGIDDLRKNLDDSLSIIGDIFSQVPDKDFIKDVKSYGIISDENYDKVKEIVEGLDFPNIQEISLAYKVTDFIFNVLVYDYIDYDFIEDKDIMIHCNNESKEILAQNLRNLKTVDTAEKVEICLKIVNIIFFE